MNIKSIFWVSIFTLAYIFVLSINILELPLYLDEGLYIFWSYLFSTDPGFAYISMQDGKTPLFIWLTTFFNQFFNNFLFTGRFVSVLASAITLLSCAVIITKILGKKSFFFVFIFFLITPFNVLISRLAFVDSLLTAFSSLSIASVFLLRESLIKPQAIRSLIFALVAGLSLGMAFFTKTTAKIFLVGEIFIFGIWLFQFIKHKKFKSSLLLILCVVIIAGLYFELMGYLKFGALRHWEMISNKESVLIFSIDQLYRKFFIEHDYSVHIRNISISLEYLLIYFGPVLLFFLAGVFWIFKTKKYFWILIISIILFAGVFLSARVPASRYFSIIIPEVLIISTFGLFWIWEKRPKTLKVFSLILILISAFLSFKMIVDPLNAFYASDDKSNFIDYNLNALGLNESVEYLKPKKDSVAVLTTGIWGVAEGSLVAFKEAGIETYTTGKIVTTSPKEEFCEQGFKELDNKCWKIDFGDISNSPKEKYVYFINENIDIETLKKLVDIEVIKEFRRNKTNLNVYLIKLN